MKLHEKILTHYLSCTSPVDKEGYLYKKVWINRKQEHHKISTDLHPMAEAVTLPPFFIERAKCHVPKAVVRPEGQPAFLPGAPS